MDQILAQDGVAAAGERSPGTFLTIHYYHGVPDDRCETFGNLDWEEPKTQNRKSLVNFTAKVRLAKKGVKERSSRPSL